MEEEGGARSTDQGKGRGGKFSFLDRHNTCLEYMEKVEHCGKELGFQEKLGNIIYETSCQEEKKSRVGSHRV